MRGCGHRRGRRAFERARREGTDASFHERRKRTKDLWYYLRLLKPTAPGIIGGHADDAHTLSDLLGDVHDLAVLRDALVDGAGACAATGRLRASRPCRWALSRDRGCAARSVHGSVEGPS
ncbi:MAG TPA: CHAD domain-containing protein [Solirubrobacteraceae bacterium]|nr:CHAD domain-containing protein [Solirubrobacteraceae bacterium]